MAHDDAYYTTGDDANTQIETPTTRVLGLGVGIFLIAFFSICFILVFLISTPCSVRPKLFWRGFATLSLSVLILLLVYAPRESTYVSTDNQIKVYDQSVIPRVVIISGVCLFAVIAADQLLKQHLMESRSMSNRHHTVEI